jgi:hypothetical protein
MEKTLYVIQDRNGEGSVYFDTSKNRTYKKGLCFGPFPEEIATTVALYCTTIYNRGAQDKLANIRDLLGCARK